jgi:hypothetical protein
MFKLGEYRLLANEILSYNVSPETGDVVYWTNKKSEQWTVERIPLD